MEQEWVVLVVATSQVYIMVNVDAVWASLSVTWSRVAPENKPVIERVSNGGQSDTITVKDRDGKPLVIAKRLSTVERYRDGTHL